MYIGELRSKTEALKFSVFTRTDNYLRKVAVSNRPCRLVLKNTHCLKIFASVNDMKYNFSSISGGDFKTTTIGVITYLAPFDVDRISCLAAHPLPAAKGFSQPAPLWWSVLSAP